MRFYGHLCIFVSQLAATRWRKGPLRCPPLPTTSTSPSYPSVGFKARGDFRAGEEKVFGVCRRHYQAFGNLPFCLLLCYVAKNHIIMINPFVFVIVILVGEKKIWKILINVRLYKLEYFLRICSYVQTVLLPLYCGTVVTICTVYGAAFLD